MGGTDTLEAPRPGPAWSGIERGRMDAIIFLLILAAAVIAIRSRRTWLVLASTGVAFAAATALFLHHATDALGVSL